MRKKTTFRLIDVVWQVHIVESSSSILNETDGTKCLGKCNFARNEIHVADNLNETIFIRTLLHEITHIVIYQFLLGKENFSQEEICEFVASYYDLIKDILNEIIYDFITADETPKEERI